MVEVALILGFLVGLGSLEIYQALDKVAFTFCYNWAPNSFYLEFD